MITKQFIFNIAILIAVALLQAQVFIFATENMKMHDANLELWDSHLELTKKDNRWSCKELISCPRADWRYARSEDVCEYQEVIIKSPEPPFIGCTLMDL